MMIVNVTEFRENFGRYMKLVSKEKEEIHLTKYGKWVVSFVPYKKNS